MRIRGVCPYRILSESFLNLGEGSFPGLTSAGANILADLCHPLGRANYTSYGRSIYAVGGNVKSARPILFPGQLLRPRMPMIC